MIKNRSIALKLSLLVTASSAAAFLLAFTLYYRATRMLTLQSRQDAAKAQLAETALSIESRMGIAQETASSISVELESVPLSRDMLASLLKGAVARGQDIESVSILCEPYAADSKTQFLQMHFSRNGPENPAPGEESGKYLQNEWYAITKELGNPVWGEPVLDIANERFFIPYFSPFYRVSGGERKFAGVVEADISLSFSAETAGKIKAALSGHAILLSRSGAVIFHPFPRTRAVDTIFTLADESGDTALATLGRRMVAGESGMYRIRSANSGRKAAAYFRPVAPAGFSLAVLLPEEEVLAPLSRTNLQILKWACGGLLALALISFLLGLAVAHQIEGLRLWAAEMALGKLDAKMPWRTSKDELGRLIRTLADYKDKLPGLMEKSASGAAQRAAYETTNGICRQLRSELIPQTLPGNQDTDLYAVAETEGEPDSAIYDVIPLGHDKLAFLLCETEASGPNVWLTLASARTLFRTFIRQSGDAAQAIAAVNDELARSGDKKVMVTALAGVFESYSGIFSFANCGQPAPLILKGGTVQPEEEADAAMLGAIEGAVFKSVSVRLAHGDAILLHSAGLSKAVNENSEQFSRARIGEALGGAKDLPARGIVTAVLDAASAFAGEKGLRSKLILALRYGRAAIPPEETPPSDKPLG